MLGDKIKNLRTDKGMFQKDLAEKVGCSVQAISSYEKGQKKPKVETLEKIASALNVTTDYLIGNEDTISKLERDFPEGVFLLRKASETLSDSDKERMLNVLKAFLNE